MEPVPVAYLPFRQELDRIAWVGSKVALLTRPRGKKDALDPRVIERIVGTLDRAAAFYASVTGREPTPEFEIDGRITIAEVDEIGGAAWGQLGATGIEIRPELFEILYAGVRDRDEYDQPLFYELGRNYWMFDRTLDIHPGSVATGYAVFMRFLSMEAAGAKGAPYRGWPFGEFRATVDSMLDAFARATTPSWETLLAEPPVAVQTFERAGREPLSLSTADLLSALFSRLASENGESFMRGWCAASASVPRMDEHELKSPARGLAICANFMQAASIAAGRDLRDRFREWRWPV